MHEIQREIIYRLTVGSELRYSRLRPKEIESNHFLYHLNQLIANGLVTKNDRGSYQLTAMGKEYASRFSLATKTLRQQSKIVTMLVAKNDADEYLLIEWTRQPLTGMISFPFGKVHLGETLINAANREFQEKTGLTGQLNYRGLIHFLLYRDQALVLDELCHIFEVKKFQGGLISDLPIGKVYWDKLKNPTWPPYAIGIKETIDQLENSPQLFSTELKADLGHS